MKKQLYNVAFYDARTDSLMSARHIVPIVMQLIRPKSVIDIGCGTGAFLSIFNEKGVKDILGVDGTWVKEETLLIQKAFFKAFDLSHPFEIDRKFSLAVCLEVAEHLPEENATSLVKSLTGTEIKQAVRTLISDAKESNSQRRCHGRTPLFQPVILRMGEDFQDRYSAFTRDVSFVGLGLLHSMPIEPQEVMLVTRLNTDETVRLIVDITWCMSCGEGWYISGGAFKKVVNE